MMRVKISKSYVAHGNHIAQGQALKSRNQHHDALYDLISHYCVAGLKDGETVKEKMLIS